MFSFEFLQCVQVYMKALEKFALPVLLCDRNFQVYWTNKVSKTLSPLDLDLKDLHHIFSKLNPKDVFAVLEKDGSYHVEQVFPFVDMHATLTPIYGGGKEMIGAVAMFMQSSSIPSPRTVHQTVSASDSLTTAIRGSLSSIFNTTDTLALEADILQTPWLSLHLNHITTEGYQILRLTENVSLYTKIQNNLLILDFSIVDFSQWLRHIIPALKALTESGRIPLEVHLPEQPLLLPLSINQFQFAFFNILHNSIYYTTDKNKITISVGKDDDDWMTVVVEDRGTGISKEVLSQALRPYFSAPPSGQIPGIGLGLSLAHRIIEAHQGTLTVDSTFGEGTKVTIRLPLQSFGQNRISFAQKDSGFNLLDRFSPLYVGLTSALHSPYHK